MRPVMRKCGGALLFPQHPAHNLHMRKNCAEILQCRADSLVRVAVNERGYRIGSSHHNSTIPDEIVSRIRDLHEDHHIGYRRLARMFNLKRAFIQKVCNYAIRAQTPARWKRIEAA